MITKKLIYNELNELSQVEMYNNISIVATFKVIHSNDETKIEIDIIDKKIYTKESYYISFIFLDIIKICRNKVIINFKKLTKLHHSYFHLILKNSEYNLSKKYVLISLNFSNKFYIIANLLKSTNKSQIVLNPTENIQLNNDNFFNFLSNYYIHDELGSINDKLLFAGRSEYTYLIDHIKKYWCFLLNGADVDLRCFSGLNAHMILFLCIANQNQKVMILPENCGGHAKTKNILKKIGLEVIEMIADEKNLVIDVKKTQEVITLEKPSFIFIDRSNGIYYEDFSWVKQIKNIYKIFDASQYLTHIIAKDYINPFDMGFDMIMSTLHKNYPGPQKAIIITRKNDFIWQKYKAEVKPLFSSIHAKDVIESVIPALNINMIKAYSAKILLFAEKMEEMLVNNNVSLPVRDKNKVHSPQNIILFKNKNTCYKFYEELENKNVLVNFSLLPYNQGYGIRIGYAASVSKGMTLADLKDIATILIDTYVSVNNIIEE